jgi:hypothetical protein
MILNIFTYAKFKIFEIKLLLLKDISEHVIIN